MLYYALVFLVIALIAGALGFGFVAFAAAGGLRRYVSSFSWCCFSSVWSATFHGDVWPELTFPSANEGRGYLCRRVFVPPSFSAHSNSRTSSPRLAVCP